MSLWGNNDNVTSAGIITSVDYDNKIVYGQNTQFGASGSAQVGDVLRIGNRGPGVAATYYGDAVITSIASTIQVSIASTASLIEPTIGNLALAGVSTEFMVSQMPIFATQDLQGDRYRNQASGYNSDSLVYGLSEATAQNSDKTDPTDSGDSGYAGQYKTDAGWVGVTTYKDNHGNLRVKTEVLVAMSGITTGNIDYPTNS
tara:strand:- start:706 stop:1308 length:603 start_codon:yes stop_codon:yes gene_type:complete